MSGLSGAERPLEPLNAPRCACGCFDTADETHGPRDNRASPFLCFASGGTDEALVMIRRFALAFACCAALAACKPGQPPLSTAEADAQALIGKEFLLSASRGRFVESSPCEFVSSGAIWENGKEQVGWFDGVTLCRGIPVLFLAKTRESPLLQDGDAPIISLPHRKLFR